MPVREYLTYAIPQRLLHLLCDRCLWADLVLIDYGMTNADLQDAAIVPVEGEFCLMFEVDESGLPITLKTEDFQGCDSLSDWADATARGIHKRFGRHQ